MFVLVYGLTKVKQSSETRIYPDELKVVCNVSRPGSIRPVTFLCSCHCFVSWFEVQVDSKERLLNKIFA